MTNEKPLLSLNFYSIIYPDDRPMIDRYFEPWFTNPQYFFWKYTYFKIHRYFSASFLKSLNNVQPSNGRTLKVKDKIDLSQKEGANASQRQGLARLEFRKKLKEYPHWLNLLGKMQCILSGRWNIMELQASLQSNVRASENITHNYRFTGMLPARQSLMNLGYLVHKQYEGPRTWDKFVYPDLNFQFT